MPPQGSRAPWRPAGLPAKIAAIANFKGGVGKTSMAAHLAMSASASAICADAGVTQAPSTKSEWSRISRTMPKIGRLMIVVLLAALAAGTVVQVANTTTMTLGMALTDDAAMDMDDCIVCEPGDMQAGSAACDMACTASFAATIPDVVGPVAPAAGERPPLLSVTSPGRTAPPDLLPPRTILLL